MSGNHGRFDRHIDTPKDIKKDSTDRDCKPNDDHPGTAVQLAELVSRSPNAMSYLEKVPQSWWALEEDCIRLASWAGISKSTVFGALARCGRRKVEMIICALFERIDAIPSPSGYFISLTTGSISSANRPRMPATN